MDNNFSITKDGNWRYFPSLVYFVNQLEETSNEPH